MGMELMGEGNMQLGDDKKEGEGRWAMGMWMLRNRWARAMKVMAVKSMGDDREVDAR
jgi:hypothetical protein